MYAVPRFSFLWKYSSVHDIGGNGLTPKDGSGMGCSMGLHDGTTKVMPMVLPISTVKTTKKYIR